jgi:hypothetical protein
VWFQTTSSDRPKDAPENFASLPSLVKIDQRTTHGSGFQLSDVLDRYALASFDDELFACAACKSAQVRPIFLHYLHIPNESDVRLELVCAACGKFTHHEYSR